MESMGNYAFIDGQNLHMSTAKRDFDPWKVSFVRFRVYLREKHRASKAFYFLGYFDESLKQFYQNIRSAGFILLFREHESLMISKKKGNVDSDIILSVMKYLYYREPFDKVILVSGDGDYRKLVDFLIAEKKFQKILFPDGKKASSLYKKINIQFSASLDNPGTKKKIEMKEAPRAISHSEPLST